MSSAYTDPHQSTDTLSQSSEYIPNNLRCKFLETDAATVTQLAATEARLTLAVVDVATISVIQSADDTHAINMISPVRIQTSGHLHLRGDDDELYSITVHDGSLVATLLDAPVANDLDIETS